jgi:glucose/arabinose dehydrogenase
MLALKRSASGNRRSTPVSMMKVVLFGGAVLFVLTPGCRKFDQIFNSVTKKSPDLRLEASGFTSPVNLVEPADGSKRLFVVDQAGKVWIIGKDGKKIDQPFLDVTSKMAQLNPGYDERGLLSLAFHPNFISNGKFYVFYTAPPAPGGPEPGQTWNNTTTISEFTVSSSDMNKADMSSEKIIFSANHPQFNHNGGTIAFGPDGYLYISIGDGGNADDVGPGHVEDWYKINKGGNGQDTKSNLLGNVLRIDVNRQDKGNMYAVPDDNPFVGKDGMDEIYAFGFRNPYRFSFDMGSQMLLLGDAGQSLYEEIDVVWKGGNYGWNVKEGRHCFSTDNDKEERASCPMTDPDGNKLIDPVIEVKNHDNPQGGIATAIVGGNIYRGSQLPDLAGKYIFGVFSQSDDEADGKLFISNPSSAADWGFQALAIKSFPNNLGQYLKGFGQDLSGEIYVLTSAMAGPSGNTGKVYKLVGVKQF